jgi:glutamyl/glutaminyl-tRNA synthetase
MGDKDKVAQLRANCAALGERVKQLKESGSDVAAALGELLAAKQALNDAALALIPAQEQLVEQLRAQAGGASALDAAVAELEALKGNLLEDKKAKKKREEAESKKRKEEAATKAPAAAPAAAGSDKAKDKAAAPADKAKKDGAPAKAAAAAPAAAPATASAAAPVAAPATAPAASPSGGPAADYGYPLMANIVSVLSGLNLTKNRPEAVLATAGGATLRGDQTIARYLARLASASGLYGGASAEAQGEVDQWMELAVNYNLCTASVLAMLEEHLTTRTYFAGHSLTLADVAVWSGLVRGLGDSPAGGAAASLAGLPSLQRWVSTAAASDGFAAGAAMYKKHLAGGASNSRSKAMAATQAVPVVSGKSKGAALIGETKAGVEAAKAEEHSLPPLEGAVEGQVVTRFPPEPSGHLHIGHVKAIFLNKYYANRYKGKMLLRFDDTNPSKERTEYAEGIVEDLKHLGIVPDSVSHTSDSFELIMKYAIKITREGNAYMDDTTGERMSEQRMAGEESARREEPARLNLVRLVALLFAEKFQARAPEYGVELLPEDVEYVLANMADLKTNWCLRAKIDQDTRNANRGNKALFDPVIYRECSDPPHAMTKDRYRAYPTYDFACPIVDSHEGVTHAMRDIQYRDRAPLYKWFFPTLGMREVAIQDFSRLNFVYTLMSKRKLGVLADKGLVDGWSDPRFPTVKGILRRGMQRDALFDFMVSQGSSKNTVDMEWDKFWNLNKKYIDPVAPRFNAVSADDHVVCNVSMPGGKPMPESNLTVPLLPKDEDGSKFGFKSLFLGPKVIVERNDVEGTADGKVSRVVVGEKMVLLAWGMFRVTQVTEGADGKLASFDIEFEPDNKDFKSAPKKIHWVALNPHNVRILQFEFDFLITKAKMEEGDDLMQNLRPVSMATTELIGEPGLRNMKSDQFCQLQRRGYMRVDKVARDSEPAHFFIIPDGKQSAMSTVSTKLTHR